MRVQRAQSMLTLTTIELIDQLEGGVSPSPLSKN